jgi:type II secretory pathway pseudopilin PulG
MIVIQPSCPVRRPRPGFTMAETLIAFAVLSSVAAGVAEFATWSLDERAHADARLESVEIAANVLEQARARPWNDLTAEWAGSQRLPDSMAARWPDCRLSVRVEPEANRPRVKRVTVDVKWTEPAHGSWKPVTLTALFAARAAEGKQ